MKPTVRENTAVLGDEARKPLGSKAELTLTLCLARFCPGLSGLAGLARATAISLSNICACFSSQRAAQNDEVNP